MASGLDRKWDELSRILQDAPELKDESGRLRKLIIFTEHKDTLNYLHAKITGVLGTPEAIVVIHGSVKRDDRRKAQALFRSDRSSNSSHSRSVSGSARLNCSADM